MALKLVFIMMFFSIGIVMIDTLDEIIVKFKSLYKTQKIFGCIICSFLTLGIFLCGYCCYRICIL